MSTRTALVFPGQGSQRPGMASAWRGDVEVTAVAGHALGEYNALGTRPRLLRWQRTAPVPWRETVITMTELEISSVIERRAVTAPEDL